jgi:putative aldouronate transport system substrate-binding protein
MGLKGVFQAVCFLAALFAVYFVAEAVYRARQAGAAALPPVNWEAVRAAYDPESVLDCRWLVPMLGRPDTWKEHRIEEALHLRIDPMFVHGESFNDARGLRFAGGDMPDVFNCLPDGLQRDHRHGFVMPVPRELILEYAPNYVAFINRIDPSAWLTTQIDGVNYAVPNIYTGGLLPRPGLWRGDWLENVGIDRVPDDLEAYEEALRRFRFDDPDGDGKRNTYGMSGDLAHWWWTSFSEIFGAFGVLPFDLMERDGKIVWGGTLPETREALTLLARWYREELIDPEFAIDNGGFTGTILRKFLNGRVGYLYYFGRYDMVDPDNQSGVAARLAHLQPGGRVAVGHFPAGPGGHRGGRIQGGAAGGRAFAAHLVDRPELVIRFLQFNEMLVTNQDFSVAMVLGRQGTHWDYAVPEEPASGYRWIDPYDDPDQRQKELLAQFRANAFGNGLVPLELWDRFTPPDELAFRRRYRKPEWGMRSAVHFGILPSAPTYFVDLVRMQQTAFTEFIAGIRSLDQFEAFVDDFHARGGAILVREANDVWRLREKIYPEMGVEE